MVYPLVSVRLQIALLASCKITTELFGQAYRSKTCLVFPFHADPVYLNKSLRLFMFV